MLNNISKMEIKIGERIYQLLCAVDSPLGEVHDALSAMKGFVIQKMQDLEKVSQLEINEAEQNG